MVITVHQYYHSLYYPTNAHSMKNVELLKHIKIMEAAPTCFGLQRNHHPVIFMWDIPAHFPPTQALLHRTVPPTTQASNQDRPAPPERVEHPT